MNIIIYGLGKCFLDNRIKIEKFFEDDEIYYSDKRHELLSQELEMTVIDPTTIVRREYDYVVVTVAKYESVIKELIILGINPSKITSLEEISKSRKQGKTVSYLIEERKYYQKKVLLINGSLGYHGGAMACINLGEELVLKGFMVDIACGHSDDEIIKWLNNKGIGVIIFESFPFIGGDDSKTICNYDLVISNTIPTIRAACFACGLVPTIWWVHEAEDYTENGIYSHAKIEFELLKNEEWLNRVNILAVSSRAVDAFYKTFGKKVPIIPVGIRDSCEKKRKTKKGINIATIGYVREDKNQLGFIQAADSIENNNVNYLVIGRVLCKKKYFDEIKKIADTNRRIQIFDEVSKDKLSEWYGNIDIIVCASYIESMSLTIIEGMMHSKICITTDGTGISDYMKDGVDGFICKAGDIDDLKLKMQYAIDHFDELDYMRENARKTYEENFAINIIGECFEKEIKKTLVDYNSKLKKRKWEYEILKMS